MYVDPISDIAPVNFGNIANVLDWDDENAMFIVTYFPTSLLLVIAFVSNQSPLGIPPLLRSKSIDCDLNTLSDYIPLTLVMDMILQPAKYPL